MKFNWVENTSDSIPKRYHIIFWIGYFLFNVIKWGSYFEDYWYSFKSNIVVFPINIVLVYFNIYYLMPKFVLKREFKKYVFFLFLTFSATYIVRTELIYFLVNKNIWPEADSFQTAYSFNHFVEVMVGLLYVVSFVTAIKLVYDWVYEVRKGKQLQLAQAETELNFLKSQIQPHFFFNTLNNLYALALEKSDLTPGVILKLSDIMRYVLYEGEVEKVNLYKELKYINNYIDLERLRFEEELDFKIKITGNIEEVQVPPLLFLPFIENCFKHGNNLTDTNAKIRIEFENVNNEFLIFSIENTFDGKIKKKDIGGIGNKNVRRRLELLYKSNFDLTIRVLHNMYIVELKLPI